MLKIPLFGKTNEETMKQAKTYNFIEITKKEFQQYQPEPISDKQAIEIQSNLFGAVDLLLQWNESSVNMRSKKKQACLYNSFNTLRIY